MASLLGRYDPQQVAITIDGQEAYGFPDGTMVTVVKNESLTQERVGTKGDVTMVVVRDASYMLTLRLQHNSPFIEVIENMKFLDGSAQVPQVVTLTVTDPSSYDQFLGVQGWIKEDTEHEWGNEAPIREYNFFIVDGIAGPNQAVSELNYAASAGLAAV